VGALTPDGRNAFVASADGDVCRVDLSDGSAVGGTLSLGIAANGIAVSSQWPRLPVIVTGEQGRAALV
jgi:hypothetical protein